MKNKVLLLLDKDSLHLNDELLKILTADAEAYLEEVKKEVFEAICNKCTLDMKSIYGDNSSAYEAQNCNNCCVSYVELNAIGEK